MNKTKAVFLLSGFYWLAFFAHGQGSFQNLGFEAALLVPVPGDPYGRVQFAQAFPGWVGYAGANLEALALYNNQFLDSAGLGLQGIGSGINAGRIDGSYTAMLQAGDELFNAGNLISATLAQTGIVPADARALIFKATPLVPLQVTLGGQTLSLIPLAQAPGYTLYGADVSAFSGTATELRFTLQPKSTMFLDSISFSAESVPEPRAPVLLGLGGALAAFVRCRFAK